MQQDHDIKGTGLPEEILTSFALFLSKEIQSFYQTEEGKMYFNNWLKEHPEYAPADKESGA